MATLWMTFSDPNHSKYPYVTSLNVEKYVIITRKQCKINIPAMEDR